MSCDCYKIGGPWVTYDPDCPAHGNEAQRERREQEEREEALRLLAEEREIAFKDLQKRVQELEAELQQLRIRNTRFK